MVRLVVVCLVRRVVLVSLGTSATSDGLKEVRPGDRGPIGWMIVYAHRQLLLATSFDQLADDDVLIACSPRSGHAIRAQQLRFRR